MGIGRLASLEFTAQRATTAQTFSCFWKPWKTGNMILLPRFPMIFPLAYFHNTRYKRIQFAIHGGNLDRRPSCN